MLWHSLSASRMPTPGNRVLAGTDRLVMAAHGGRDGRFRMSRVHRFYDFAASYLLPHLPVLSFWPLLPVFLPLVTTLESRILILLR
jgi:hypothetical protein